MVQCECALQLVRHSFTRRLVRRSLLIERSSLFLYINLVALATTQDRAEAEKDADVSVVATHAAQNAARLARRGSFSKAQMETRAAQRFMLRNNVDAAKIETWSEQVQQVRCGRMFFFFFCFVLFFS